MNEDLQTCAAVSQSFCFTFFGIWFFLCRFQGTLKMKGVKEMKALLDILELDSSVYVRIQVSCMV